MRIKVYPVKAAARKFYRLKWKNAAGKWEYKSTKFVRRRDAERAAKELEDSLNSTRYRGDGSTTWDTLTERYDEEQLSGKAKATRDKALRVLARLETEHGLQQLSDVTPQTLSAHVGKLRKAGLSEQTISSHLRHLKAALRWAEGQGMISRCPRFPVIRQQSWANVAHGRPLTESEFAKLEAAANERGPEWGRLVRGLWLSGLRLTEALVATWHPSGFQIDLSGDRPYYRIHASSEKGNATRMLAVTPDAAEFFTPLRAESGAVFPIGNLDMSTVSRHLTNIAKVAGVVLHDARGKERFAGAHDLRRSFGERWAGRVQPHILKELMRHAAITTTMTYYVLADARRTSDEVWKFGAKSGATEGNGKATAKKKA